MNQFMDAVMTSHTKELPEDIVNEIQLRLPIKSLIRFKCVSKHWFSLITDAKFTRLHLNRLRDQYNHVYNYVDSTINSSYPQTSVILSFNTNVDVPVRYEKLPAENILQCIGGVINIERTQCIGGGYSEDAFEEALDLDFPLIPGPYFEIKCCCDGLVCLVISTTMIILWNPSIRQYRKLPRPPYYPMYPHANFEIFGVGYDSRIDDYKVVRFPSFTCRRDVTRTWLLQANVFNLKSNYWTRIEDFPCSISQDQEMPMSAYGGLYWIASLDLILRFDLADETFKEIALPPPCKSVPSYRRLGLWGGFISMLCGREFWVMKGDCEQGWTKVMIVPKIPAPHYSIPSPFFEPLCLTKSGKVVAVVDGVKFVLYDPREETVRELNIRGLQDGSFNQTLYFESLVSPWGGKQCQRFSW